MAYDPAQARCLRLAAGMTVLQAANLADIAERAVFRFEEQREARPFYIDTLDRLLRTQDTIVDELVDDARRSGEIRTYFHDDALAATHGRLPFASVHQVSAGRAALLVPEARVVAARDDVDIDATLTVRAARIGLVGKAMARAMQVSQSSARRWLSGTAPMTAEKLEEFTDLEEIAEAHRRELTANASDPVLRVSSTQRDLAARWPDLAPSDTVLGLDLAVHQTIAGQVAHATGQTLAYVPATVAPSTRH